MSHPDLVFDPSSLRVGDWVETSMRAPGMRPSSLHGVFYDSGKLLEARVVGVLARDYQDLDLMRRYTDHDNRSGLKVRHDSGRYRWENFYMEDFAYQNGDLKMAFLVTPDSFYTDEWRYLSQGEHWGSTFTMVRWESSTFCSAAVWRETPPFFRV